MLDIVRDLENGSRTNVNMPLERPCASFCFLAMAMLAVSVAVCDIITVKMFMTLILTFKNGERSNVNIPIEMPRAISCVGNNNACPIRHRLRDNHV